MIESSETQRLNSLLGLFQRNLLTNGYGSNVSYFTTRNEGWLWFTKIQEESSKEMNFVVPSILELISLHYGPKAYNKVIARVRLHSRLCFTYLKVIIVPRLNFYLIFSIFFVSMQWIIYKVSA